MAADASRRSLARVVEAALHFFGVANVEQLEGLLDDTEQRAMLRNWLRSVHCPLAAVQAWERQRAQQAVNASPPMEKFVEVDVAEKMIDEALRMGDERIAQEVAARVAAEQRAEAAELHR